MKKALLLVDLQNDFMPGGPLGVAGADEIIPFINHLQSAFDFIVATQDWHPINHGSFANNHPGKQIGELINVDGIRQILWPTHCIQYSQGADFAPGLITEQWHAIIQKGMDPNIDSYSGFFDNAKRKDTGLHALLQKNHITHLFIAGLATDYCVKFTALDACALGYQVSLYKDACRAVNLRLEDGENAIAEMMTAGIEIKARR